jgi:hypothetical protein
MDSGINVPSSSVPGQGNGIPEPSNNSPVPIANDNRVKRRDYRSASATHYYSLSSPDGIEHGFAADAIPAYEREVFAFQ